MLTLEVFTRRGRPFIAAGFAVAIESDDTAAACSAVDIAVESDELLETMGLDGCAMSTVRLVSGIKPEACFPFSLEPSDSPDENECVVLPVSVDPVGSIDTFLEDTVRLAGSAVFGDSATSTVGDGSIRASGTVEASLVDSCDSSSSTVSTGCAASFGCAGVARDRVARFLAPVELSEREGWTDGACGAGSLDTAATFFVPEGFFVFFVDDADDVALLAGFTDADLDRVMRTMMTGSRGSPRVSRIQRGSAEGWDK